MKLKIDKIARKEIVTQRGPAWKLSILSGKQWYGAWANDWNAGWREGQTVDVSIRDREYNGKTYFDITGLSNAPRKDIDIEGQLAQIMKEILEIKKLVNSLAEDQQFAEDFSKQVGPEESVPTPSDEDAPPEEELPF